MMYRPCCYQPTLTCVIATLHALSWYSGPLVTNQMNDLSEDLTHKSRSHEIVSWNNRITWKFGRHFGSRAAEMPVKFQSDQIIINTYFWDFARSGSKWVIKFNGLCQIVDSKDHVIHIGCVIVTYTVESLSSLKQMTCNLQATINLWKKGIKEKHKKVRAPTKLTCHWRWQLYFGLQPVY